MQHDPTFSLTSLEAARVSVRELKAADDRRPDSLFGNLLGGTIGQWMSRISSSLTAEHVCAPPDGQWAVVASERHVQGSETYQCPECTQVFAPLPSRALDADGFPMRARARG